ncbi:DNA primase/polymerase [Arthrobacter phage Darby]|uniref:DNA primase/polymerase n=1 Tax=Arthrobacter phage Darby TaxID=2951390 RepID=A0A9E7SWT5_9CAUD|nr:DNA primase/polymerase [Arthrobacter phage Darby]UTN92060.1 DNA primase/polymerase [Arthrobacter phage Darby]
MDFYKIKERRTKEGVIEVYPDFKITRSKDLMVRSKAFYAVWDEKQQLWSQDEFDVQRLVDDELRAHKEKLIAKGEAVVQVKFMDNFSSGSWLKFRSYLSNLSDNAHDLDENLTFSNTEVRKDDYVSKRLPYPLAPGDISAWDEIVGTLYEPDERAKIEWAIGAIVSGDSKKIQKFLVFYGAPGTGKGTILDVVQKLFEGYTTTFDAKALTGNNAFATEAFRSNPLVAIDPDGDMSKIEDNTKLNSIVGHEPMNINEKYKSTYTMRIHSFLLMATNKAVKITDAKSGLIRRMIDVHPSGAKLAPRKYAALMSQIDFELGAIAQHCVDVYRNMGRNYYSGYQPIEMMLQTDIFFNYIENYYDVFRDQDGVTLQQAFEMWKTFAKDSELTYSMPRHKLREELKNYFANFEDRAIVDGMRVRSWFSDFNADKFKSPVNKEEPKAFSLVMDETESLLDLLYMDQPAQYSNAKGDPRLYWTGEPRRDSKGEEFTPKPSQVVSTTLKDLDTTKEHYVKPPHNHIVIDFDLTDTDGNKSAERNLAAASVWPATYAELSKSGAGVHLHYIYDGDATELSRVYDDGIEVKVFTGNSSLRRRLSKCNNVPVATINSGLPIKEKKVINQDSVKSEQGIRNLIERNLKKEIMPGTKPSIDFIDKILKDAYDAGEVSYDVTDMRGKIMAFANNSSHQALYCLKKVQGMKFKAKDEIREAVTNPSHDGSSFQKPVQPVSDPEDNLVIFDLEVFPNLFIISWSYVNSPNVVRMVNPSAMEVGQLLKMNLVGFNNRRYDNHILYGAFLGFNNEQLYKLSKKIIDGQGNTGLFGEAYNLSYADIYDFASKKQGLKKWQIELGLPHDELGFDWDQPVPEKYWDRVGEYCDNDVITTKDVLRNRWQDLIARRILAELSGLRVNDPTAKHTAKIVFGDTKNFKEEFVYTDLSEMFPGYKFDLGKSTYKGETTGEGGYVYAEPGMYTNVALLDVVSMHPTSIKELSLFGSYTDNFWALVEARIAIKREDYDLAKTLLGGKLAPYLKSKEDAKALSYALKIVINIVYGLTSATFDNPFRDMRNKDNIVAKRGALFMLDLKEYVQKEGFVVAHIKTDSIKIPDATPEIIQKVTDFGAKYGYDFEHEKTYEKMALVNDAVYVGKVGWSPDPKEIGKWDATGVQFKVPFVYKTMFTGDPIQFADMCVAKHATTAIHIDFTTVDDGLLEPYSNENRMHHIGKGGLFTPIIPGKGGGQLVREKKDKSGFDAVAGTKGFYWMEAEMVKNLGKEADVDKSYFETLVNEAYDTLGKYGDVEWFLSDSSTGDSAAAGTKQLISA